MGRAHCIRLSAANEILFKDLHHRWCLANENRTFNALVERSHELETLKPALFHLKGLLRELGLLKERTVYE